jgi:hypothetical protein
VHRVRRQAYGYAGCGAAVKINPMHCSEFLGTTSKRHCANDRRYFVSYQL